MARKTPSIRVAEAKDEREEMRKALNDTEAPTRAEISTGAQRDGSSRPVNAQEPPRRQRSRV